ncbi:protein phosphatase 2C domain-containing protein [Micromonospora echinospora]|uniref:protein phosphatase 2C domain-containing protein n=1 Tax=Micromonospora echinospora TaxID=1877 RepID=UPI00378F6F1D
MTRSVPKLGREPAENEDSVTTDPGAGRFAVADGASTSARSEIWSRLLVEAFVSEQSDPFDPPTLAQLRGRWSVLVNDPTLPWYAQAKLQHGAAATFLGLSLDPVSVSYRAVAMGDSCLFHLRGTGIVQVGPIDQADGFGRFPELLSTRPDVPVRKPTVLVGEYRPGDVFALATDAMAAFLLAVHERYGRVPPVVELVHSAQRYARFVAQYRWRGQLTNDDTTLCVVRTW